MNKLIFMPHGCGEQNIMRMTLTVIAATYLDKTNQWEAVGFDKRREAIGYMNTGKMTCLNETDFFLSSQYECNTTDKRCLHVPGLSFHPQKLQNWSFQLFKQANGQLD